MVLIDRETNELYEGVIDSVESSELKSLQSKDEFIFDWSTERNSDVYKISIKGQDEILGLLSLIDIREEFRIHINLIEASKSQRGKNKKILNIPVCLIGFACKISFRKGYSGFVSLIPKTYLIDYYQKKIGFVQIGKQLATYGDNSKYLMLKYLQNEQI